MGGAASSVSTNLRLHHLTKDQLIPEVQDLIVFEKHADPSGHITVDKLLHVLGEKTDVYIAHDHSMDRETLSRCAKVNSYLQSKGLLTFFAEGRLLANKSLLAKGIENASLILVCITPGYMENASIAGELCSFEFDYATRHKAHRMLPLVFDSNLRSPVDWTGPISTFASAVFVDLSSPVPTADAMDQLLVRVMGLLGRPLHVLMEDQAHALSSDHSVVYPADKVPDLPQAAGLPFGPIPRGGLRGSATTGTAATADASGAAQAHAHAHAQDHSPTHSTHSYEHAHGHGHGHSGSPTHTTLVNGVHVTHYAETEPIIVTPRHPGEPFDWDALLASLSGMDQRNDPAMELITALITDPLAVNRRMHYRSDAHATEHRWTLLQWAVHVHNVLVIDALLAVDGIDPNLTEDAQTPLCMAAVRGYEDTVERLVKVKDIDLNAVDKVCIAVRSPLVKSALRAPPPLRHYCNCLTVAHPLVCRMAALLWCSLACMAICKFA